MSTQLPDLYESATTASPAPADVAPRISVRNLCKTYNTRRGPVAALRNVSMDVAPGEVMVLLGPSGCGKTTLLRCVAGLEYPDSGEITVQGKTVFSSSRNIVVAPENRNLSMVFQSYALWPHMTVFANVAFPLTTAKVKKADVRERVHAVLQMVGLDHLARSHPGQLSGGQQQRVSLARALVADPGVILFDEPLSNLDAKVRERLRDQLLSLQDSIGFTALYVTHDQTEATGLGDSIAVMEVGSVAQLGTPTDIYYRPSSRYVADFVGSANELKGTVVGFAGEYARVDTPIGSLLGSAGSERVVQGQSVSMMFRPEHCHITDGGAGRENHIQCVVDRSMFLGSHVEYVVDAGGQRLALKTMEGELRKAGATITVRLDPTMVRVFPAE
ncbi:iron(III) transport system ATP-binding protein [Rhodococcus wratislaviensis]|uniref:Trehalose import ATP-binding protein SugC n=1 Tax=Rhodococcus wratislaviensis TaxID=44752 RepID=A0AB38FCV9_RHOWR|nr:ABC transporter ATP-binding protein [Rhodococcus wratislaviensis]REE75488.1 iron(III) transport system ATP-binding protein [Rhodococcus wratislaviensis]SPZ39477.1 ABC transporter ATP-binding protein [Rhodococcus wratislaviensis]